MQPDVSIIIPVYNLEKYIGATLESALVQQDVHMEILVVDDYSTDNTAHIVALYGQKYPCVKLLRNERTKGVSGARNTALQHMTGKTCFFLDGDDFLPQNVLKPLFSFLQKNSASIVLGQNFTFCEQRWLCMQSSTRRNDPSKYPINFFTQYLYNTDFIKRHACFFPEDCVVGEDLVFFCQFFSKVAYIASIVLPVHIYRINDKPTRISVKNAPSFIRHVQYIRHCLENSGKAELIPSAIQATFYGIWLQYAYYTAQENVESILNYLNDCAKLFAGIEEKISPLLQPQLQGQSDAFWKACKARDAQKMLIALQQVNALHPVPTSYFGIRESLVKNPYWKMLRCLQRMRNIGLNITNAKRMYYIYTLQQKAKKFLASKK